MEIVADFAARLGPLGPFNVVYFDGLLQEGRGASVEFHPKSGVLPRAYLVGFISLKSRLCKANA
jgi:hypothetical protein